MVMCKKGIMIKFLVTMLITILVFGSTILVLSKLFRLSEQAENNFDKFVTEIQTLAANDKEDDKTSFVLILDRNTFIWKFSKPEDLVTESVKFEYPKGQCKGKECIVLCKDFVLDSESKKFSCKKTIGKPLEQKDTVMPFFLYRFGEILPMGWEKTIDTSNVPRRTALVLQKESGKVYVRIQ